MDKMNVEEIIKEIQSVTAYPDSQFIEIIRDIGFECDRCGKCCTNEFNDHVFLLDEDAERISKNVGQEFLRPAPYFEYCDNLGRFYVMGYALKNKPDGSCIFYTGNGCKHYAIRPAICSIFPYMLHREEDGKGNLEFRQIGGLDEHGSYHNDISDAECRDILKTVKQYETSFLRHRLAFEKKIAAHFKENSLKYSRQSYDKLMREYDKGKKIEINVFFRGGFEREFIQK